MYYLLGIDDTDSEETQDTWILAFSLGRRLETLSLAKMVNISCHQLLKHPSITLTFNNVACCLLLDADALKAREIDLICREVLHRESASMSNPGFALAAWNQFDPEIVVWRNQAKINQLSRTDAISLGRLHEISMAGIMGSGIGVIGALAAVGLRYEGNGGWISWLPGIKRAQGVYTQIQLSEFIHFDRIETERGIRPAFNDRILFDGTVKPLLKNGKVVLHVSAAKRGADFEWQACPAV